MGLRYGSSVRLGEHRVTDLALPPGDGTSHETVARTRG